MAYWLCPSLPSWSREFDSLRLLQVIAAQRLDGSSADPSSHQVKEGQETGPVTTISESPSLVMALALGASTTRVRIPPRRPLLNCWSTGINTRMFTCEKCKVEHEVKYGSGRFCSTKCARAFSTSLNRAVISAKVKQTFAEKPKTQHPEKTCPECLTVFRTRKSYQKFCSKPCSMRFVNKQNSHLLSERAKRLHREGRIKSWGTRHKLTPSYPEQYFIDVFTNEKIQFEREKKIGRWFVDFVIGNYAIEVDGKQHDYPDRKKSDEEKDAYLKSLGWEVIRIRWHDPRRDPGRKLLHDQIHELKKKVCP